MEKVGGDGVITVEEAKTTESALDVGTVRKIACQGNYGFDAGHKEYVDLEAGIIDPSKVVRIALENAVSVASVLAADRSHIDRDT